MESNKSTKTMTYWRCTKCNKTGCRARLVTFENCFSINKYTHNHSPAEFNYYDLPSKVLRVSYIK